MRITKAHAYGNDFLFVEDAEARGGDLAGLARSLCARHRGVGADGLILYELTPAGARMRLLNADGSYSEVSGNGVRCLAVIVATARGVGPGADPRRVAPIVVETDAGRKVLEWLGPCGRGHEFRASMGPPSDLREVDLDVVGEQVRVVAMRVGNPQCVVLGAPLTDARMRRLGPALERHAAFPEGTNVEFAEVMTPEHVRMLIWERGVGPTEASGTGACAAAVAAAAFGGALRAVEVESPGGTQRVEWMADGLFLTGCAEIVFRGEWIA